MPIIRLMIITMTEIIIIVIIITIIITIIIIMICSIHMYVHEVQAHLGNSLYLLEAFLILNNNINDDNYNNYNTNYLDLCYSDRYILYQTKMSDIYQSDFGNILLQF